MNTNCLSKRNVLLWVLCALMFQAMTAADTFVVFQSASDTWALGTATLGYDKKEHR